MNKMLPLCLHCGLLLACPGKVGDTSSRWRSHLGVLHFSDDLQVPLGRLCDMPLLWIVAVDACAVLRTSVIALPVLHAGVYVPPENL
jgi:hypothetical protein